jgi:putative CocE/NonD family hydrolase
MDSELSEIRRHDEYLMEIDAGTVAGTRFEPVDVEEPRPAVLMFMPYHKDDWYTFASEWSSIEYLARHGYEVISADVIGTGGSSGRKSEPFSSDETEQISQIIHYLADEEWSNGCVGMFGRSYPGTMGLKAAAENPEPLKAIVPMHAISNFYDIFYRAGIDGGGHSFAETAHFPPMMQALQAMPPSYRDDEGRWADVWMNRLDDLQDDTPWLFQFLRHPNEDEYWQRKNTSLEKVRESDVPTLAISGYRDGTPTNTLEYFEALQGEKRMLFGPWRHTAPHQGREARIDYRNQMVEWFDHFLKREDNGALDYPKFSYWTEREGGSKVEGGVWRKGDSWPTVENSETLSYALTPKGLQQTETFETGEVNEEYDFDPTVGMYSQDVQGPTTDRPLDSTPDDIRSLTFETEPLSSAVEFTGTGEATIRLKSTTQDPTLAVRLVDVGPDGSSNIVANGALRVSKRNSTTEKSLLTPGEEYEITTKLKPKSHIFEEGHKIRVAISSAYFPFMLPTCGDGSFTINSSPDAPSTITFPGKVHSDEVEFSNTFTMDEPDESVPLSGDFVSNASSNWTTTRDHQTGKVISETFDTRDIELPHTPGATMTYSREMTASVFESDPLSWEVDAEIIIVLDYPDEEIEVTTNTHTNTDWASSHTVVERDGETLFDEKWRTALPDSVP